MLMLSLLPVLMTTLLLPTTRIHCRLQSIEIRDSFPSLEIGHVQVAKENQFANEKKLQLQKQVLQMMGIEKFPDENVVKNTVVPDYMVKLATTKNTQPFQNIKQIKYANVLRSFHPIPLEKKHNFQSTSHHRLLRFNVSLQSFQAKEMLDTGELKLFISELGCTKKLFTVKVYLLKKFASTLKRVLKHAQLLDSQLTLLKKKTLLSIDVTKAVQIWLSHKHFEQFLLVEIVHIDGSNPEPHSIFLHSNESDTDNSVEWSKTKEPLLVLYSTDPDNMSEETPTAIPLRKPKRSRRRRRSVEDRFNNKCERHSLMVDFHEINWSHWIVAPKAFNAFLCDGLCPFPLTADINATNHAIVQTILHVFDSRIAPSVCCIPMTLKTMMILYIDYSGSVTLRKYINMIVDSCGCG